MEVNFRTPLRHDLTGSGLQSVDNRPSVVSDQWPGAYHSYNRSRKTAEELQSDLAGPYDGCSTMWARGVCPGPGGESRRLRVASTAPIFQVNKRPSILMDELAREGYSTRQGYPDVALR